MTIVHNFKILKILLNSKFRHRNATIGMARNFFKHMTATIGIALQLFETYEGYKGTVHFVQNF